MGSISCVLLYWFEIEIFTSLFYFLALIGFWSSLVFYNSFLPDIAYLTNKIKQVLWLFNGIYRKCYIVINQPINGN